MSNDSKKLQAIVVHGSGDKAESILRGRAMAVHALMSETSSSAMEILDARIDLVIVFSGSKTMGADSPSEAELMYQTFAKRLGILKARMERLDIPVPDVIDVPSRSDGKKSWKVSIGSKTATVILEEDSVDTEDNAEKTASILERLVDSEGYDEIVVSPMSSQFHVKRVSEAFKRNAEYRIAPMSAEKELERVGWRYEKYARLEMNRNRPIGDVLEIVKRIERTASNKSVGARPLAWTKRVIMEICLSLASRTEAGRKIIRMKTAKRLANDPTNEIRP